MGELAIIFALDVFFTTLCMFVATKLSFVHAQLKSLIGVVAVVSLLSLVPMIGWVLGLIAFVYLLMRVTDVDFMDCIWVVIFTKIVSFAASLFLFSIFAT